MLCHSPEFAKIDCFEFFILIISLERKKDQMYVFLNKISRLLLTNLKY